MTGRDPKLELAIIERVVRAASLSVEVESSEAGRALFEIKERKRLLGGPAVDLSERFSSDDIQRAVVFLENNGTNSSSVLDFLRVQHDHTLQREKEGYQRAESIVVRPVSFQVRDLLTSLGYRPFRLFIERFYAGIPPDRFDLPAFKESLRESQDDGFSILKAVGNKVTTERTGFWGQRKRVITTPKGELHGALHMRGWNSGEVPCWMIRVYGEGNVPIFQEIGSLLASEFEKKVVVKLVSEDISTYLIESESSVE